jgi:ABC-2 type transport system ATP-binding protein
MGNENSIFQISGVRITYGWGRKCAVNNLTLELKSGVSLGVLGLNGAGKTSTIRALLGMLRPSEGTIRIFDKKPGTVASFRRIGFAPEDGLPPDYLSGEEYLRFIASFKIADRSARRREALKLLEWFELPPTKRIRDYSKGMKRRIILAQAFLGTPDLLILDEPLNGLDPIFIIRLRERIEAYRQSGGSLLVSSHILNEIERTCSEVAILHNGDLVCRAPVEELQKEFGSIETAFATKIGKSKNVGTVSV